jgi:hypothetical protein
MVPPERWRGDPGPQIFDFSFLGIAQAAIRRVVLVFEEPQCSCTSNIARASYRVYCTEYYTSCAYQQSNTEYNAARLLFFFLSVNERPRCVIREKVDFFVVLLPVNPSLKTKASSKEYMEAVRGFTGMI